MEVGFEYVTERDGVKLFRKQSEQKLVFAFLEENNKNHAYNCNCDRGSDDYCCWERG